MNPIRIENGIILFYGNCAGRVEGGRVVADPMFRVQELERFLKSQHIRDVQWVDGIFERLTQARQEGSLAQEIKNVRVWQLKPDVDVYMKFIGYEETCRNFGLPNRENYQAVYDGVTQTDDLEVLYMKFGNGGCALPAGYRGHSLSMSDVLEIYDSAGSRFFYVDRVGFQEIEFAVSYHTQNQEMQL